MLTFRLEWVDDPTIVLSNLNRYEQELQDKLWALMQEFARRVEEIARSGAPWHDVTGAARAGLTGQAVRVSAAEITLVLFHTVSYGIFLEMGTVNMDPLPAIMPAMEVIYGDLMGALQRLVG